VTTTSARPELDATRILKGLRHTIGNTPLLAIHYTLDGDPRTIFVKSEQLNMTGSIKDRMALHILETAYREGTIHPGDTIAEATSGNTGISFSAIGRALGHPVRIFMPDWMSRERVDLIHSLGAEIVPVSVGSSAASGSRRSTLPPTRTFSCRASSPTRGTSAPTNWRRAPRSGGNCNSSS
jgi:cysteine synthase A